MNKIKKILLTLAIFSISFDIFLIIKLGSATIRFSNVVIFILGVIVLCEKIIQRNAKIKTLTYPMLPMFFLIVASFLSITGSEFSSKSIIYSFLVAFNFIFYIWLLINVVQTEKDLQFVLKVYIFSFLFVSFFALYQFTAPFFGHIPFLAKASFFVDNVRRVNAFTYEAGCLATYLIPGLVLALFWRKNNIRSLLSNITICVLTTAIILSTSRAGWIGLILIFGLFILSPAVTSLFSRRSNNKSVSIVVLVLFVFMLLSPIFYCFRDAFHEYFMCFSVDQYQNTFAPRFQGIADSLEIFIGRPVFGAGIGALGAYMLNRPGTFAFSGAYFGDSEAWNITGTNVATEILASMGIVGFLCWTWLLCRFIKYVRYVKNKTFHLTEWRATLEGLLAGFIIQLLVLQFNQNFFRAYVMLNMGITLAACCVVEKTLKKRDIF